LGYSNLTKKRMAKGCKKGFSVVPGGERWRQSILEKLPYIQVRGEKPLKLKEEGRKDHEVRGDGGEAKADCVGRKQGEVGPPL